MPHDYRDDFAPTPWWQVALGGVIFACSVFGLIWGFAILGFLLEGPAA